MTYRILSFDGGGVRGILPLVLLSRIHEEMPDFISQTDLFAGTSVGGLIALALAQGQDIDNLKIVFKETLNEIFPSAADNWLAKMRGIFRAKYGNDRCRDLFTGLLGSGILKNLKKGVLITAFNLDNCQRRSIDRHWTPVLFSNLYSHNDYPDMSLVDVALCTSAAPVYFPSYQGYVDGGIAVSNPALAALLHTQDWRLGSEERQPIDEIVILSLGTGLQPTYLAGECHDWGYFQWARHLMNAMYDGSIHLVDQQCRQLLGVRYHRISPAIPARIRANQAGKHDVLYNIANQTDLELTIEWARRFWFA